jgi:agmatinase
MENFKSGGIVNSCDVGANHVILGAPFDLTSSGAKGADGGPKAIKEMLEYQIEPYHQLLDCVLCDSVKIAWHTARIFPTPEHMVRGVRDCWATPEQMVKSIKDLCLACYGRKQSFTVVGGEHSVTIPALIAYAELYDPSDVTIVAIDAHLDLRDTDEYRDKPYGKFAHCCVMRRAHELGFNILNVGARAVSKEEHDYAKQHKDTISILTPVEQNVSIAAVCHSLKTKKIWVSVDVDGICPGDMPATGTPVGGGVSLDLVRQVFFQLFIRGHQFIGADVVEVAPKLGPTDLTAYNAAQLVYELIGYQCCATKKEK